MSTVCVARQPIFDRNLKVVAYELLFRDCEQNVAAIDQADDATSQVLLTALVELGLDNLVGNQSAFVNFTSSFVLSGHCDALPADRIVLELLEGAEATDALVSELKDLIDSGFRLALDDFVYLAGYDRLLDLASIVKMDLRANQDNFRAEVDRLKRFPAMLLAEKVETPEEFDRCLELGFGLFQGYFFARPRLVTGRRTPSDRLTTLRLIASLNAPDISLKEVESLIVREPVLAQKLLKFINSTHVGLRVPVNSIGMAVALEEGLIVPVIHDAARKNLKQIAAESKDLAERARSGQLKLEDVNGGTFTVTNLGTWGIDVFTPILNVGETGILGVGRIIEKPAVYRGEITRRSMLTLSLTFDHRAIDGAPAAAFLQTVIDFLNYGDR